MGAQARSISSMALCFVANLNVCPTHQLPLLFSSTSILVPLCCKLCVARFLQQCISSLRLQRHFLDCSTLTITWRYKGPARSLYKPCHYFDDVPRFHLKLARLLRSGEDIHQLIGQSTLHFVQKSYVKPRAVIFWGNLSASEFQASRISKCRQNRF